MSPAPNGIRHLHARVPRIVVTGSLIALTAIALLAVTGCGSSSKPAYCADRTNLEQAVKSLPGTVTGGVSALKSTVATIQSDATALVSSAKSDFPSETSALKSSIDGLKTAVDGLPSSPSASDIAPVALDASATVNAVNAFTSATKSKCG